MKCRYCKTKISLTIWLLYFGMCYYCDRKMHEPQTKRRWKRMDKQKQDSNKYWENRK